MIRPIALLATAMLALVAVPAFADSTVGWKVHPGDGASELPPYIECVPFARDSSGIRIYGDAYTWWDQAAGHYARGSSPKPGAVMALRPYGAMVLGHVATVSAVIDSRTVLLSHANWSPIGGQRGQVERNVKAIDVSPQNDWSEVRIWYAPQGALGTTRWPVAGFIYPQKAHADSAPVRMTALHAPAQIARSETQRDPIGAIIRTF